MQNKDVKGNGTRDELVLLKLGKAVGVGGRGKFLWELHSLSTSGYIKSSQGRDKTGTDKLGSENKES